MAAADPQKALDASGRAALEHLADIVMPPPVSWAPQTWGWALLALLARAGAAWTYLRWRRRREANRYRMEALAELATLEARLAEGTTRGRPLAEIPRLLKRTALAVWPRPDVASLSQAAWVAFLRAHAGGTVLPDAATHLLDDAEYRSEEALAAMTPDQAQACARAARAWIEGHRVSA